jgi:hypothetical protein
MFSRFLSCKLVLSSAFACEGQSYCSVIISLIVPHERLHWLLSCEYSIVV